MSLVGIVLTLVVVGVLLWLLNNYVPMDSKIKSIVNVVVVIVVVVWLLQAFGVLGSSDFAIRVGPGATRAPFRIGGPDDVARVLRAVVELRNGGAPASRR